MLLRSLSVIAAILVVGLSAGCEGLFTDLEDIPVQIDDSENDESVENDNSVENDDPDDNETSVNQGDGECTEHAECLADGAICHNNWCTETNSCDSDEQCSENFPRCEKDIGICFPGDDEESVENDADGICTSHADCLENEDNTVCHDGGCTETEPCTEPSDCVDYFEYCHEELGYCIPDAD